MEIEDLRGALCVYLESVHVIWMVESLLYKLRTAKIRPKLLPNSNRDRKIDLFSVTLSVCVCVCFCFLPRYDYKLYNPQANTRTCMHCECNLRQHTNYYSPRAARRERKTTTTIEIALKGFLQNYCSFTILAFTFVHFVVNFRAIVFFAVVISSLFFRLLFHLAIAYIFFVVNFFFASFVKIHSQFYFNINVRWV